jgi:hypothetical protein
MAEKKACVFARGTALCPDFAAMERGVRRMLGRTYEELSPGQWGWRPTGKSELVERSREIAYALADGDLYAGDEETAAWAGALARKPVDLLPGSDQ